jgi:F-type H+-transporting ATPase subunit alpha
MRSVAGSLRLDLAQYRDLEAFAAFASDLDAASRAQLDRGLRLVELLKQGVAEPYPMGEETISIWAGTSGELDDVPVGEIRRFENEFLTYMRANHKDVVAQLNAGKDKVAGDIEDTLKRAIAKFKQMFKAAADDLHVTDAAEDALEGDVDVETVKRVKKG